MTDRSSRCTVRLRVLRTCLAACRPSWAPALRSYERMVRVRLPYINVGFLLPYPIPYPPTECQACSRGLPDDG